MNKPLYDSDEELFVEPPKLSHYSMALLNDNKENISSGLCQKILDTGAEHVEFKESDLAFLDQDNDMIIPDHETPCPQSKIQNNQRWSFSNLDRNTSLKSKPSLQAKKSYSNRALHNALGHPRRISSRKSSTESANIHKDNNEKLQNRNSADGPVFDDERHDAPLAQNNGEYKNTKQPLSEKLHKTDNEQHKDTMKDTEPETTSVFSYTSSHSQPGAMSDNQNNTITNDTSVDAAQYQAESNIDFQNLNPYEYMEMNDVPKAETSSIIRAYEVYTTKNRRNNYAGVTPIKNSMEQMHHASTSEHDLYEQLRRDRAKQEEMELELEKKRKIEFERHQMEQQMIEAQKVKKDRFDQLRRQNEAKEKLRAEQERKERELEQEKQRQRLRLEDQQRERKRMFTAHQSAQQRAEQLYKRSNFQQPIQQQVVTNTTQQPHNIDKENISNYTVPKETFKSYAQSQREPQMQYNVVKSSELVPLKQETIQNQSNSNPNIIVINNTLYERLELIGKGGSSKVYKAKSKANNKTYAVKEVLFDEFDETSIDGFKGEIDLLVKLREKRRVVRLVDYALENGRLYLVMECGDIDLAHVLNGRLKYPLDADSVRFHAKEVLRCVQEVHDAGIVHSDLKPANFLFVKGTLKLIDFGISNAVPEHTVNIYRDSQIGTPNYMAPEALIDANIPNDTNANGTWKVGKPSDVWSCGCIIYQMIYGKPPYGQYNGHQRLLAIMNPDIEIQYPDKGLGNVKVPKSAIQLIKSCLQRDPKSRLTVDELLKGPFLNPRIVTERFLQDLIGSAIQYGASNGNANREEINALAADVWDKILGLNY